MPKTVRNLIKRDMAEAIFEMQMAIDNIANVGIAFGDSHPSMVDGLNVSIATLDAVQKVLFRIAEEAWGYDPEHLMVWRR
jgi:hypothetical protein